MIGIIYVSGPQTIHVLGYEHDTDDWVTFQWFNGTSAQRKSRAKVRYDYKNDAFFVSHGHRFYMRDAVRTNN